MCSLCAGPLPLIATTSAPPSACESAPSRRRRRRRRRQNGGHIAACMHASNGMSPSSVSVGYACTSIALRSCSPWRQAVVHFSCWPARRPTLSRGTAPVALLPLARAFEQQAKRELRAASVKLFVPAVAAAAGAGGVALVPLAVATQPRALARARAAVKRLNHERGDSEACARPHHPALPRASRLPHSSSARSRSRCHGDRWRSRAEPCLRHLRSRSGSRSASCRCPRHRHRSHRRRNHRRRRRRRRHRKRRPRLALSRRRRRRHRRRRRSRAQPPPSLKRRSQQEAAARSAGCCTGTS